MTYMNPFRRMALQSRPVVQLLAWTLVVTASSLPALAQETLGEIERLDAALDALLPSDAKIEVLAKGFTWTEGPVWVPEKSGGYLLFSDIPRNSGFKWTAGAGVSLFLHPSGYTGNTFYGR